MIDEIQWRDARRAVRRAARTSLQCSVASVNADGSPHITPIGSLMLDADRRGFYFDVLNSRLAANIERDPRITILAVDSGRWLWLRSMALGRFDAVPGIRLLGRAGPARPSTPKEIARFHERVGPLRRSRGGLALWGSLDVVRDVEIDRIQNLNMGSMTRRSPARGTRSEPSEHADRRDR